MKNKNFLNQPFLAIIGEDVVVNSFNHIGQNCYIDSGTVLQSFNNIVASKIGKNCYISASKIEDSLIKNEVKIGPSAYIRPQTILEDNSKAGAFVEIKKSHIGRGTKVPHLSYVGDATLGQNCNIGCGVVFCNYDGKNKHQTIIEDDVFVGSNTNLVAPIKLEKGCFVAAGSTLTQDVPQKALAIARGRQVNKLNYKGKS